MPIWCPPTPPQDVADVYIDKLGGYLYKKETIPESSLPSIFVPPKHPKKQSPTSMSKSNYDRAGEFSMDISETEEPTNKKSPSKVPRRDEPIFAPRSLFDRPSPAMAKMRRDFRLQKYSGSRPTGPSAVKNVLGPGSVTFSIIPSPNAKPPPPPPADMAEWMIAEDFALLQTIQTLLELPSTLFVVNLAQTPNWELAAEIVNMTSRTYRTAKHCKWRYENIVGPREEGKVYDTPVLSPTSPTKKSKKTKAFIKITPPSPSKASRYMKTSQLLAQDNNMQMHTFFSQKFETIKSISAKRAPAAKPVTNTPTVKSNKQAAIFAEHGITYDTPLPATAIALARFERLTLERKKILAQTTLQTSQTVSQVVGTTQSVSSQSPTISLALAGGVQPASPVASPISTTPVESPVKQTLTAAQKLPVMTMASSIGTVATVVNQGAPRQCSSLQHLPVMTMASSTGTVATVVNQGAPRQVQLLKQQTIGGKTVTRTVSDAEMQALLKHHGITQQRIVTSTQAGQAISPSSPKTQVATFPMSTLLTSVGIQNIMKVQQQQPNVSGQQITTLVKATPDSPHVGQQGSTLTFPLQLSQVKTVGSVGKIATALPKQGTGQVIGQNLSTIQQQLLQCHKQQQHMQVSTASKMSQISQIGQQSTSLATQLIAVQTSPKQLQASIPQFQQVYKQVSAPGQVITSGGQLMNAIQTITTSSGSTQIISSSPSSIISMPASSFPQSQIHHARLISVSSASSMGMKQPIQVVSQQGLIGNLTRTPMTSASLTAPIQILNPLDDIPSIMKAQQQQPNVSGQQITTLVKATPDSPHAGQQGNTLTFPLQLSQVKTVGKISTTLPKQGTGQVQQNLSTIQQQLLLQRHKQQQHMQASTASKMSQIGQVGQQSTSLATQLIAVQTSPKQLQASIPQFQQVYKQVSAPGQVITSGGQLMNAIQTITTSSGSTQIISSSPSSIISMPASSFPQSQIHHARLISVSSASSMGMKQPIQVVSQQGLIGNLARPPMPGVTSASLTAPIQILNPLDEIPNQTMRLVPSARSDISTIPSTVATLTSVATSNTSVPHLIVMDEATLTTTKPPTPPS